jgi:alpha-amylase
MICNDNDYNYAEVFTNKLSNEGFSSNDIKKIKLWNINYLNNLFPICDSTWKILPERFVLSLANHNNQNPGAEDIYIVHHNLNEHKNRNIQLLSDNSESWKIKLIFSSYSIMENGGAGFPDGKSDCSKCITEECNITCTKSVPFSNA